MKQIYLFLALLTPGFLLAQQGTRNKEVEQIVITKKGSGNEKLNIVVDGDRVTVNGQPAGKGKDAAVTVIRRRIKDPENYSEWAPGINGNMNRMNRQFTMPPQPNKAMLGVTTRKTEQGVEIMNVSDKSAAEKAGLKEGDIITELDHRKIETPDELSKAIKDKNPGEKVTVTYLRDKKQQTAVADLTPWKAPSALTLRDGGNFNFNFPENFDIQEFRNRPGMQMPRNNLRLFNYNAPAQGQRMGLRVQDLETGSGVKVIEVEKGSDADKAGLRNGDIITEVDGTSVKTTDDAVSLLRFKRINGKSVKMKIDRNGKNQQIEVPFTKKVKTANL
jgi:serine protease Do